MLTMKTVNIQCRSAGPALTLVVARLTCTEKNVKFFMGRQAITFDIADSCLLKILTGFRYEHNHLWQESLTIFVPEQLANFGRAR